MPGKMTNQELGEKISRYHEHLGIPATYEHKKTGNLYRVLNVGYREADMAIMVAYRPMSAPVVEFYRPYQEFLQKFKKV